MSAKKHRTVRSCVDLIEQDERDRREREDAERALSKSPDPAVGFVQKLRSFVLSCCA